MCTRASVAILLCSCHVSSVACGDPKQWVLFCNETRCGALQDDGSLSVLSSLADGSLPEGRIRTALGEEPFS